MVSYNRADRPWAEWIAWQLEDAGYTTVLQAWDFRAGGNWVLDMQRAAAEADRTVAVLSPDFLTSAFTQPEWAAAFAQDPTGEKGLLVPVRVRECSPQGLLRSVTYIDLVDAGSAGDAAAAHDALLAGIQRGRRKPMLAPPFPVEADTPRSVAVRIRLPGALPPIWNVPFRSKPSFTGQEELLATLRSALTESGSTSVPQVLLGLGGTGKTQIAVEYAWRYANTYNMVWWVRADQAMTLASDYTSLAMELQLPTQAAADQPTVVKAVHRRLQAARGWLLLFDDASGPEILREYLPPGAAGHVLITSRHSDWGEVAQSRPVPTLSQEEASLFLRRRVPQAGAATEMLADELGELPLALEQAAAYMAQAGRTSAEYVEMFRKSRRELLARPLPPGGVAREPVATTWKLAFDEVQAGSPAAADLLNLCAFLARRDIFHELVHAGVAYLPSSFAALSMSRMAWDDAVLALRHYSLVEATGDVIAVHRLVQAVVRDRLSKDDRAVWTTSAVRILEEAFPDDPEKNVESWPICVRLLPHAMAVVEYTGEIRAGLDATARLLNKVGTYLRVRAQFTEAKNVLLRALAIAQTAYGSADTEVAAILNNLGEVSYHQDDLPGARSYFDRSLAIRERVLGLNHADTAESLNNLGVLLQDQGDLTGARSNLDRALAIKERVLGANHRGTATTLHNLGSLLEAQGDLIGARSYLDRALAIREGVLGADHPETATSLNNIGFLLQDQGDLTGARPFFQRALAISEETLGPDHPDTVQSLNNLGALLLAQGDLTGARPYLDRALAISEKTLGPDHPDTAQSLNNLGALLQAQGDIAGARPYYERALAIWQERGDHHREAAGFLRLGRLEIERGDPGAGARLVALCYVIDHEIGHADSEKDWHSLTTITHQLGYSPEQTARLLQEAHEAYQANRSRSLVQAALRG